jgi:hypothetical protein
MPTTPAPDLATLFAHEKAVLAAWCAILRTALSGAGVTVGTLYKTDLDAEGNIIGKSTPFVDVVLTNPVPTGHLMAMADESGRYDAWQGNLETTLVTTRGKDSEQAATILGEIRELAQRAFTLFDREVMPYHGIGLFREAGGGVRTDQTQRLDLTTLLFTVRWNVLPAAWPEGLILQQ